MVQHSPFEAENAAANEELALAARFVQSLAAAYAKNCTDRRCSTTGLRAATSDETLAYRKWLAEFAEEAERPLIVPLTNS